MFYHILCAMKFKVHLRNFSKVSTRAGCGGSIYLEIIRASSHTFYGFILLSESLFYSLLTSFFLKRENPEPILSVKIIEWRRFIDYFGLSSEAEPSKVGKNPIFCPYLVYINLIIRTAQYIKSTYGQRV